MNDLEEQQPLIDLQTGDSLDKTINVNHLWINSEN